MEFEFDKRKSAANQAKHGIDFVDAQRLWEGTVVRAPARNQSEVRELAIGRIAQTFWTAIVTSRGEKVRLISVRRLRAKGIALYQYVISD